VNIPAGQLAGGSGDELFADILGEDGVED